MQSEELTGEFNGPEGSSGAEGSDSPVTEEDGTAPEESGGEDCSQYVPGNALVPSEDPNVPSDEVEPTVQENIEESESSASSTDPVNYYLGTQPGLPVPQVYGEYLDDAQYFSQVAPGGEYDYKGQVAKDSEYYENYAAFGNFNFGATGAARGYPEEVLLEGAGPVEAYERYQQGYGASYGLGEESDSGVFPPLPKDYDTEGDQQQIMQGYDYYECLDS